MRLLICLIELLQSKDMILDGLSLTKSLWMFLQKGDSIS